jgi:uroporphyrinogen-III synthase
MPGAAELFGFTVGVTSGPGSEEQATVLTSLGAEVVVAPVHRPEGTDRSHWELPADPAPALELVELVCRARVDAVTFNAGRAVRNFMALADRGRRGRNVLTALNSGILVVCSGPDCAAEAREEGIAHPLHPPGQQLGPLVHLLRRELLDRRRRYLVDGRELVFQGSVVSLDGRPLGLSECERAVLVKLVEKPGVTVSRRVLLRHVWKDPGMDPAVLDVAIERLGAELGPVASSLEVATRRGYRLRAVERRQPVQPDGLNT